MATSFASGWRAFWHTMTSYDRHASHDSPYRTGSHTPLSQSRHAPLTSVATSAMESRQDLSYTHDGIEDNPGFVNGTNKPLASGSSPSSPQTSPYKPGMRATLQRVSSDQSASGIQMQNFSDGLPPAPPVEHSWKRIDRWAEDTYAELYDNLSEPCTQNDVNELEHELDCTLPLDVRQSIQIHDGQERGGLPTGIIFGMMLLDCEEIVQEWQNWQKVGQQYLSPPSSKRNSAVQLNGMNGSSSPMSSPSTSLPQSLPKAFGGSSAASSSSAPPLPLTQSNNPSNSAWRSELMARQTCHPPNTVQQAYTHHSWIPLARDWGGNCLAVDLAPGPAGKWGQVIIMGRDYDCKFVVARSWAHFLAGVADDFAAGDFKLEDGEGIEGRGNGGKVYVNEETGELRFREFWDRQPGVDVPYLEVLRWRCERKYGRRAPPLRRPASMNGKTGLKINANNMPPARPLGGAGDSPYGSPTSTTSDQGFTSRDFATGGSAGGAGEQRGRSPNRFSQGKAPHISSPLAQHHTSAPLDRVAEEPVGSAAAPHKLNLKTNIPNNVTGDGHLVSVDSPRASGEFKRASVGKENASLAERMGENQSQPPVSKLGKLGADGLLATPVASMPPRRIGEEKSVGKLGADGLLATPVASMPLRRIGEASSASKSGAEDAEGVDVDEMKTVAI